MPAALMDGAAVARRSLDDTRTRVSAYRETSGRTPGSLTGDPRGDEAAEEAQAHFRGEGGVPVALDARAGPRD